MGEMGSYGLLMGKILKRIWHDPVCSKVIAGIILAALTAMVGLSWKPLGTMLLATSPTPNWLLIVLGIIIVVEGLILVTARKPEQPPTASSPETIYTIGFDYLPTSPLENGWKQEYNADGVAEFGSDPDIPGSLRMKIVRSEVAIHHNLPPHATLADHLEYTAKYTNTTMIFTRLIVGTKDGSVQKQVDIKYYYGELRAVTTSPNPNPGRDQNRWLPEQTICLPAQVLAGGRLAFNIDLRDAVSLSLGQQGWVFKSVQGVRLRSNLSISPLVFGKARTGSS
jgi:hypothetical protein